MGGGGLYLEGRFNRGFFALPVWGLIFAGAYTWRGLFSEFYGICKGRKYVILVCKKGPEGLRDAFYELKVKTFSLVSDLLIILYLKTVNLQ